MRLLADENFPHPSVRFLAERGHDVRFIALTNPGAADEDVVAISIAEVRIILTFDRDYGALIFHCGHKPPAGVIYLRLSDSKPDLPGILIHDLLTRPNFFPAWQLTTFNGLLIRQRYYGAE